jgi:hypothetical protein
MNCESIENWKLIPMDVKIDLISLINLLNETNMDYSRESDWWELSNKLRNRGFSIADVPGLEAEKLLLL